MTDFGEKISHNIKIGEPTSLQQACEMIGKEEIGNSLDNECHSNDNSDSSSDYDRWSVEGNPDEEEDDSIKITI